jgi:hypothetical protein
MEQENSQQNPESKEQNQQEIKNEKQTKKSKKADDLEKIELNKIRGRVIVLDPEKSEFAQNLGLNKKADYKKKK